MVNVYKSAVRTLGNLPLAEHGEMLYNAEHRTLINAQHRTGRQAGKDKSNMNKECRAYAESIRNDLNNLYKGNTVDECEDIYQWVCENSLDIEYTMNYDRELIGVRLYVTLGGPTCWIDTRENEVVCAWGTGSESAWLASEICDMINEMFVDVFERR